MVLTLTVAALVWLFLFLLVLALCRAAGTRDVRVVRVERGPRHRPGPHTVLR